MGVQELSRAVVPERLDEDVGQGAHVLASGITDVDEELRQHGEVDSVRGGDAGLGDSGSRHGDEASDG